MKRSFLPACKLHPYVILNCITYVWTPKFIFKLRVPWVQNFLSAPSTYEPHSVSTSLRNPCGWFLSRGTSRTKILTQMFWISSTSGLSSIPPWDTLHFLSPKCMNTRRSIRASVSRPALIAPSAAPSSPAAVPDFQFPRRLLHFSYFRATTTTEWFPSKKFTKSRSVFDACAIFLHPVT